MREIPRRNGLLEAVRAGRPALGPTLHSGSPEVLEVLGRFPFHFITLEMEHTPYNSFERLAHLCRAADAVGITPIASLGEKDPLLITKVLELGVMGIVAPHVTTAQDAMLAVAAAKYPPEGRRGAAGAVRQSGYGIDVSDWQTFIDGINQEVVVIGKVEDINALDHLDDILRTDVDGLMVGSMDLSHSLGIKEARGNVFHPRVIEARDHIFAKCQEHGKFAAAVLSHLLEEGKTPAQAVGEWSTKGVLVYTVSSDLAWLRHASSQMATSLKEFMPGS